MSDINVGGQAVIEGVMIRSAERVATAVRKRDGSIVVQSNPYHAIVKRMSWLNVPIVRGAVAFFEMLIIGVKSLNFSADMAARDIDAEEREKKGEPVSDDDTESQGMSTWAIIMTTVIGLGAGVLICAAASVNARNAGRSAVSNFFIAI